ncbi:MAG: uroporphyrinogen decarboxylase family protein [Verrucomicrobiota bacterium]
MNERQRFLATMHYQPRDRVPIVDFGFWPETIVEWHKHGLPESVTYAGYNSEHTDQFFGMDNYTGGVAGSPSMLPTFDAKVLEDRGDYEVAIQHDGVIVQRKKFMGSIPEHLGHTLVDRASWEKYYQWRFDPTNPDRYPKDWDAARMIWNDPDYPRVHVAWGGSFYGWIRDWMGMEAVSYLVYDDPVLLEEMVETLTVCKLAVLEKMFANGARYDACSLWEDMCFNNGPLLAPEHFKRILVPRIKRVTELLRRHGCDIIWVDCDGKIDELLPLWLDAGVNCMFPIEVGTWGADPVKYRKQYGKDLLMMGGFDKHILARSKSDIENEVRRLAPLVEEGGFIPMPDHRVPPDVPFDNYLFYLEAARKIWGKETNLRPLCMRSSNPS